MTTFARLRVATAAVAVGCMFTAATSSPTAQAASPAAARGQAAFVWGAGASASPTALDAATDWASISTGPQGHWIARKADGTLWAWGGNAYGQLGLGDKTDRVTPTQVGTDTDWTVAYAANGFSVAQKRNGTLWEWGGGGSGELGLGDTQNRLRPRQVGMARDWASIAESRGAEMAAIKTDGTLWVWGANFYGQLGLGDLQDRLVPTQLGTAHDWAHVSPGNGHTMAIKTDGTLWAWGDGWYGQLGTGLDGPSARVSIPQHVGTDTDWASVAAGTVHTLATKTDGSLWAWGDNMNGQTGLGQAYSYDVIVPTRVGVATSWAHLDAGAGHSAAIDTSGALWAWGNNSQGQVGDGTVGPVQWVPERIGSASDWVAVTTGFSIHSGGLRNAAPPAALASDTWSRTTNNGWGTADLGGTWTSGQPSALSTDGSAGWMTVTAAGGSVRALLSSTRARDLDAVTSFTYGAAPTAGYGAMTAIILRHVAANTEYRARVRLAPDGTVRVVAARRTGTAADQFIGGESVVAGLSGVVTLRLRVEAIGAAPTTLRVKVWAATAAEPAAWTITRTDSTTVLQTAGTVGLTTRLGPTTPGPITCSFDDLVVGAR